MNSKQHKESLESTGQDVLHHQPAKNTVTPYLESNPSLLEGTQAIITTSKITKFNSIHGTAVQDMTISAPFALVQPPPPAINEESDNYEIHPELLVSPGVNKQASGKVLNPSQNKGSEILQCTKISPTKWKVQAIINL